MPHLTGVMDRRKRNVQARPEDTEAAAGGAVDDSSTSELLTTLASRSTAERVRLGEIVEGAGLRAYGFALMLVALPEALPLPIVGITAVVALPLAVISAYMVVRGTDRPLPSWVRRRSIKRSLLQAIVAKATPLLRRVERVARPRPRWQQLAQADRILGSACLVLAVVIALPIPFGNILPALCIVGIALGMLQRDGIITVGALAASIVTVAGMTTVVLLTGQALLDWSERSFEG
jgi:hypothetical protein